MRRLAVKSYSSMTALIAVCGLVAMSGCANNPAVLQGQVTKLQEENKSLVAQTQDYQAKLNASDGKLDYYTKELARASQQAQLNKDQADTLRRQLAEVNSKLTQAKQAKDDTDKRLSILTASTRRRGGVSINANSSQLSVLPAIDVPGTQVRRDGEVIRIELPGHQLFESGSAQLRPGAANLIAVAAAELARTYPNQLIGIEGHTDSDPVVGRQWRSNHELSLHRAMAVYNVVTARSTLKPTQLQVIGHGSNCPVVSNATPAGKQRNRRVELVIYPEVRQ